MRGRRLQDTLLQRCFAAEQLTCVAGTDDGALCAAGGISGRIYVWQAGSGRLLKAWPAHYKVRGTHCRYRPVRPVLLRTHSRAASTLRRVSLVVGAAFLQPAAECVPNICLRFEDSCGVLDLVQHQCNSFSCHTRAATQLQNCGEP